MTIIVGEQPGSATAAAPAPEAKPAPARMVLVSAELSRTQVFPGDAVRLTELVPVEREIKMHSVSHRLHVIGEYDFTTESLVNWDAEKGRNWSTGMVFGDCSISVDQTVLGDKWMPFSVTNPRQEGMEFDFKARQIGIFVIVAKWKLYRSKEIIESNPVILTVSPPLDKAGKPIIKEEWIDKTAWKYRPK